VPANGKAHLPRADQLALADIAQRFAPGAGAPPAPANEDQPIDNRAQPQQQPLPPQARPPAQPVQAPQPKTLPPQAQACPRPQQQVQTPQPKAPRRAPAQAAVPQIIPTVHGMKALIVALIGVALLPSALFGAMLWSGAIHTNSPATWLKTDAKTWTAAPASVTGALRAEPPQAKPAPASHTATLPPREDPEEARIASTEQAPKITQESEVTGSIASVEDEPPVPELPYDTNLIGVVSWDVKSQPLLGATGVEEVFTTPEEPAPPPEHLMRAPEASDDEKNWITAPQFVNLRKGPTSSAAVISVVAKGTKLAVKGRKRGWVQVANPETSESGWIYTGSKGRRAKRAGETEANGGSSWLGLGSLLGSQ
jgi:uncharacterized protein YgiM (DUF1202 family)